MKVICDHCGRSISRSAGLVKKTQHHFCNTACYVKYRKSVWKPKKYGSKNNFYQKKLKDFAFMRLNNVNRY
jgi:hypothetical protein